MKKQPKQLDKLSSYFQEEMRYLMEGGRHFAQRYPRLAQRLDFQEGGSDDPHVARLLESFAFLTARLHMKIDDHFTGFTSVLLGALYPQFVNPVPSATVVKFLPLPSMAKSLAGTKIPERTALVATSQEGDTCHFQTTMPLEIWPLEVIEVSSISAQGCDLPGDVLRSPHVLKIRIRSMHGDLANLSFKKLCLHLAGDYLTAQVLYEWLLTYDPVLSTPVFLKFENEPSRSLGQNVIKPLGFDRNESLFPTAAMTHHAYQLLLEYCAFPQKYMFVNIEGFPVTKHGRFFDLLIPLGERATRKKIFLSPDHIQLSCVPAVNLFSKTAEPIRLDHRTLEYRLVGDHARERTTEVHSIVQVSAAHESMSQAQIYAPYFSFQHGFHGSQPCFWIARRAASVRKEFSGTDLFLSFVDYNLNPKLPADQTIYAHTLCTNRNLAMLIPPRASLEIQGSFTGVSAFLMDRPTTSIPPPLDGQVQWRLISHLSLNHLGLCQAGEDVEPLQELLRLYRFVERNPHPNVEGALVGFRVRQTMGRVHCDAWRGFVPQLSVDLAVDETVSHGLFLLGMIFDQIFRLSSGFNTLLETSLYSDDYDKIWKTFSPQLGLQVAL